MLAGSLLLHALLLAVVLFWPQPDQPSGQEDIAANDVSLVMQSDSQSPIPASTKSPDQQTPSVAAGSPAVPTVTQPSPNTAAPVQASSAPTPSPPTPEQPPAPPVPDQPPPVPPTPPQAAAAQPTPAPPPAPVQEASIPPPTPSVPDTTPLPPAPATPPQVSLTPPPPQPPAFQQPPPFVPPQPPPPLPPLPQPRPRPPTPRRYARPVPRSPSGFPMPQDWSLNQAPSPLSSHGFDTASAPRGGHDDQSYKHIGGADPGPDWMSELHRWAAAHAYYPEEARNEGQQGSVTVHLVIDHYGHVLSVDMVDSSGSPFLDAAWAGEWRNAKVPAFPQGTMGDTTTIEYTINYILIRR